MARKNEPQRRIDRKAEYTGGGLIVGTAATPAPPSVPTALLPPDTPEIGDMFVPNSAVTPTATVNIEWDMPQAAVDPVEYVIQWALDSGFTNPTTLRTGSARTNAAIGGLPTGTAFWVRVAAVYPVYGVGPYSASATDTTPADTTPPAAATSFSYTWSQVTGDLTLAWVVPTSKNYRDTRIRIYASNGGTLLREKWAAAGRYVWTKAMQEDDTSGAYDTAVYVVLTPRSFSDVYAVTDLTGSPTIAAPSAPSGLTHTWSGDTGTAPADLVVSWTAGSVAGYRLTLDGVARDVGYSNRYTYTFDTNRGEHSGTPDPVISISLVAINALGQVSSASTATATNAAPPAASASAAGTFAMLAITITASTAADLLDYRIRTYLNGSGTPTDTIYTSSTTYQYEAPSTGSWRADVAARDKFGQVGTASSLTTAADLQSVSEFVTNLRSGLRYSDSISTAEATLAALKDGLTASNTVVYTSSTPWRWTQGDWQQEITHQTSELYTTGSASYYLMTSLDGSTWTAYAGGTATGGRWLPVSQASEAAAQTAATTLAAGLWRIDLPAPARARYIRLGHRNTTTSYAFREFFPSTLIRGTYVEAESITAVQIAAGTITGDRLTATAINGFTITGATIQTAASGARAELTSAGLKTYDSAGVVQVEATTSTDGALRAGAGVVQLDADGIVITPSSTTSAGNSSAITWKAGSTVYGDVFSYLPTSPGGANTYLSAYSPSGSGRDEASVFIFADSAAAGGPTAQISVIGGTTGTGSEVAVFATTTTLNSGLHVTLGAQFDDDLTVTGDLAVTGGAAFSTAPSITVNNATTNATDTLLNVIHNSTGTPAANFGAQIRFGLESTTTVNTSAAAVEVFWNNPTHASRTTTIRMVAVDSGGAREGIRVSANGSAAVVGFFGGTGGPKPTVTGSRGGNAALADLLTELATLGLIIDSSSA